MLDSLREAFRQAIENFKSELDRDRVPEAADRLLRAMQSELVRARRHSEELASHLAKTREEAGREKSAAETCLRRESMAREIQDDETADVAREFAAKHLRRHEILSEKAEVIARELDDRRRSLDEMMEQFKEARLRRESLAPSVGRTGARERMREADDLFREMDRMADRIRDFEGRASAAQEIGALFDVGSDVGKDDGIAPDVDARLEELKRRMGKE